MIPVRDFNNLCTDLVTTITDLKEHILVAEDNHAVNRLTGKKDIILVAVIPSSDRAGRPSSSVDENTTFFFVVKKFTPSKNEAQELDQYEATQIVIEQVKDYILGKMEDGCHFLHRLEPSSIHIDPAYNIFGGFSGWSMSLTF
ncbi:MAG: hypothetical protein ABJG41_01345 [Cyclobacteriaceae bacterium]